MSSPASPGAPGSPTAGLSTDEAQEYLQRVGAPRLFEQLAFSLLRDRPGDPGAVKECLRAALDAAEVVFPAKGDAGAATDSPAGAAIPLGHAAARKAIEDFATELDRDGDGISMTDIQAAQEKRLEPPREDGMELSETLIGTVEELGYTPRKGEAGPIRGDFEPGAHDALLVIDVQYDFCPGGPLATESGTEIIPTINGLIDRFPADRVYFAQDWHPPDHWSFATQHPGHKPHDMVKWEWKGKDIEQVLWPDHCIQDSRGAEFRDELTLPAGATIVRKGIHKSVDSYSIFYGADHETSTGLRPLLTERKIERCYVCGIAYDFCVKFSAIDAVECGHSASVIRDACAAVALPGTMESAAKHLSAKGVTMTTVTTHDAISFVPSIVALDAFALIAHADLDGDQKISQQELLHLAEGFFQSRHPGHTKASVWSLVTQADLKAFKMKFGTVVG
eukprot:TRINITY_DN3989_c0_g1_i1.p1 TRINITY_DN3989_c0_g1~~TRINITY_DN3989_c0_g1_i1.p1  ORF type:complete len:490 (+),score=131.13 TRINITY_DN3989_c0_g1_i1:126-1472(+)